MKLNSSHCESLPGVLRSSLYPITMSKDFQRTALKTMTDIYLLNYKGEGYIKRTVNEVDKTVNISIIKFGFGTPVHDGIPNVNRTIWSGTDKFFAEYMYNLNHYFAQLPCEFDIIIFQYNGIWYIENCC